MRIARLALLLIVSLPAAARAEDPAAMARELARLRTEVEALSQEIEGKKDEEKARLRALYARRGELEAELGREEVLLEQMRATLEGHRRRIASQGASEAEIKPAVLAAIAELRAAVQAGLPFMIEERLDELAKLERQVNEDVLPPSRALGRLWERVEDEARLGRESGLYLQVVPLGEREVLAEVARIGMVMLFFRTPQGEVGRAVRAGAGWRFERYTTTEQAQQLEALFDAFKKQIRVGRFELPNALAVGGDR
jgi:hypothetical protein